MRRTILLICIFFLPQVVSFGQFSTLSVINGYGTGNYQLGDTVHIWSVAYDNTKTFKQWSGDIEFLESPFEWHTTLLMPNHDISISAEIIDMPTYSIEYEQIMGYENLKDVYFHFPSNLKGVIYLFHGTGGKAAVWVENIENRNFVNAAIANSFGVIITEAEEITLNNDLNGDGKLRWQTFPIDTVNGIDYLNVEALTDTFVSRNYFDSSTPKFSVGMSNGGSFSAAISYAFNYKAGISYCASSAGGIFQNRNNPFAFRMALYDDNESVGAQGNYEAWQNDSILEERGVCHNYKILDRQPLYPERFARIAGISTNQSQIIFNELLANNQLNVKSYALNSDSIANHVQNNVVLYPTIGGLSMSKKLDVLNQIAVSNAEHKFYSDYNFATLDFLNNLCSNTSIDKPLAEKNLIQVYPILTTGDLNIYTDNQIIPSGKIYDLTGNLIQEFHTNKISVSNLSNGVYIVLIQTNQSMFTTKIIKQ